MAEEFPEAARPRVTSANTKTYRGQRVMRGGMTYVEIVEGGERRPLPSRTDLRNHSPDGFAHGYTGSGPSQLALAICCDALGDDALAQKVYQDFKFARIAQIETDTFEISAADVITFARPASKQA